MEDLAFQTYLQLFYESSTVEARINMELDIKDFGSKICTKEYIEMGKNAEANKPYLEQFDAYGKRIDEIHTSEGWRFFKKESAIEKLISLPYKNTPEDKETFNPNARLH